MDEQYKFSEEAITNHQKICIKLKLLNRNEVIHDYKKLHYLFGALAIVLADFELDGLLFGPLFVLMHKDIYMM
jgi:hypothetical protein